MRLNSKARLEGIQRSIDFYLGAIDVQLPTPDQPSLLALFQHPVKEASEHFYTIAGTNTREARMVGKLLAEIVSEIPAAASPISRMTHEQTLGADVLKKPHQLQFEEHDGINRGTPAARI